MNIHRLKNREHMLFWRRFVDDPKGHGSIWPSSRFLASFIGKHLSGNSYVVELGAGTGRLTQGILDSGYPAHNLICVEMDPDLCRFLKRKLPNVCVIEGRAEDLSTLLPPHWIGNVSTIVSGIPMMNLSPREQIQILESCWEILAPQGRVVQFTYSPGSPFPKRYHGIRHHRLGHVWLNFPPASVWACERG